MRPNRVLWLILWSGAFLLALWSAFSPGPEPSPETSPPANNAGAGTRETSPAAPWRALADFRDWTEQYAAIPPEERREFIQQGVKLAAERRSMLAALIESDPEQALREAVPIRIRRELPREIVAQLEERVADRGEFAVLGAAPNAGTTNSPPPRPIRRFARLNGRVYRTYVYGRRQTQPSRADIPVHGIAIDDQLALDENPVRPLEPGEIPDPGLSIANPDEICGISRLPSGRAAAAQVGNEIVYLCNGAHIAAYNQKLIAHEDSSGPSPAALPTAWTSGIKTVLYIRVNFTDDTAASISAAEAAALMNSASNRIAEMSYNLTGLRATVTPLLTMPHTKQWYLDDYNSFTFLDDARAKAKANGYDTANFDLDCVNFKPIYPDWTALGYVGGKGIWFQTSNRVEIAVHEFGHNYGLWHANAWNPASPETIFGPGLNEEYGNPLDTMATAVGAEYHFNACHKNLLGWLPDARVLTITSNGLYRLYSHDTPTLSSFFHALQIQKDSRYYWIEFRNRLTGNKWTQNGVLLSWAPWSESGGGNQLLDTTPGSVDGRNDSAITLGRTFSDPFAGIHITPVRKYTNTIPASMDVVVNLGAFPNNAKPTLSLSANSTSVSPGVPVTLTASAGDPNGDQLAYDWDFSDPFAAPGTNGPVASKSWSASGEYVVRCTVSDMKGAATTAHLLVRVGSSAGYRISGRVLSGSTPVEGARVSTSSLNAYTDANGDYLIANLSGGSYTVQAFKAGWTFTASFANPVGVGPGASNINFNATPVGYPVSGRVTDNNTGVAGVTVSIGTNSTVTSGSGNFTFSNVAAGLYHINAAKFGYELRCQAGWTNPVPVEWVAVTNRNFERPLYPISGIVSNVSGPVVSIGDTIHQSTGFASGGHWNYSVPVPRGKWNLIARLSGYTLSPANFINPVAVTNAGSGFNFRSAPGTTYVLSGNITESGQPLPDVRVDAGTASGYSDTVGNFAVPGLSNGNYLVSATLSDYAFSPATRDAAISGADLAGQDFLARLIFRLTRSHVTDGQFQFRLSGGSNRVFRIETSPDLDAWTPLSIVTNTTGQLDVFDPSTDNTSRFYRAALLP